MPPFAENQSVLYSRPLDLNLMDDGIDAKLDSLTKVGGDSDWNIYYLGSDGSKWIKSYPNSGYHGGGRPSLKKVDKFPELPGIKISLTIHSKTLSLIDHHFKTNVFFPSEASIWELGNAVYEGVFIQKVDDKRFMVHAQVIILEIHFNWQKRLIGSMIPWMALIKST
jgi:hypothetical protein